MEELAVEALVGLVRVMEMEEAAGKEAFVVVVPCSAVCCDSHWAHGSDSPCSRCSKKMHKNGMRCTFHSLCSSTRCA